MLRPAFVITLSLAAMQLGGWMQEHGMIISGFTIATLGLMRRPVGLTVATQ
jgi:hypothetical protein